uniref:Uncharacterized protein n=1 Tax=Anguilla anguilla TaxID=7936 RepID=A0A0E9WHR5_ANGAN
MPMKMFSPNAKQNSHDNHGRFSCVKKRKKRRRNLYHISDSRWRCLPIERATPVFDRSSLLRTVSKYISLIIQVVIVFLKPLKKKTEMPATYTAIYIPRFGRNSAESRTNVLTTQSRQRRFSCWCHAVQFSKSQTRNASVFNGQVVVLDTTVMLQSKCEDDSK